MGKLDLIDALEEDGKDLDLANGLSIQEPRSEGESNVILTILQKKIQRLDEEIKDLQQDREQRKVLSYLLFGFMCSYMAVALATVFLCGLSVIHLNDTVIITLLTTTLANVIGIFSFVAKYLYHNK